MIIFDLDGTLSLTEHRQHLLPDWDAFFAACVDDLPNRPVINVFNCLEQYNSVQIWSGRSNAVRKQTEDWLYGNVALYKRNATVLRMRAEGDFTPDDELKLSWIKETSEPIQCVFDDRDKVVAMWRSQGIPCFQVAPGSF